MSTQLIRAQMPDELVARVDEVSEKIQKHRPKGSARVHRAATIRALVALALGTVAGDQGRIEQLAAAVKADKTRRGNRKGHVANLRAHQEGRRQRKAFERWTAPIGTPVEVTLDDGKKLRAITHSMPWLLGGETPVILVEGITGGYLLTRVRVIEPEPKTEARAS